MSARQDNLSYAVANSSEAELFSLLHVHNRPQLATKLLPCVNINPGVCPDGASSTVAPVDRIFKQQHAEGWVLIMSARKRAHLTASKLLKGLQTNGGKLLVATLEVWYIGLCTCMFAPIWMHHVCNRP